MVAYACASEYCRAQWRGQTDGEADNQAGEHQMKTSTATVSIAGDLGEKLAAIAKAGFDGIEIFEQDFISFDLSPSDVREMVADHGLEITLFQPFRDFEGLPEGPLRQQAFSRARHKFDLMCELGTDLMLICSSVHPAGLGGIDRCADDFREIGELASSYGVRVGYEALAWGRFINDHRDAWEVVRRADHKNVGLILDSFHTLGRKIDPDSIRTIPGDKIFFVQLADAPAINMDLLYWSRHFRNMPGEGDLDLASFMDALHATGYDGPLSLEIFNDEFRRGDAEMVARDGHRSLINLMDDLRRRSNLYSSSLPVLPDRVEVSGVQYVELACKPDDMIGIESLLNKLGLVKTGTHKSKEVTRFQSGNVNILVNPDPAGRSFALASEHGTVVSEVAFVTPDAAAAHKRAVALGAESVTLPSKPGEQIIPTVRGVAESLIRFLDPDMDIWNSDFDMISCRAPTMNGVQRIDHIAQTMGYDEMLSWTQFFTSIFSMVKSPMIDVIDPEGIIRSQAVTGRNGGLRLTLNGSEARRTSAHRFVTDGAGATVQHLAFAVDDAVEMAEHLYQNGFSILPQTANYYADLTARFDLPSAFIAKLKALNILYDEDESGHFLHFYSATFGNGLFFEFVERRDGYDGFGAPNAPFRLAAQRRMTESVQRS